jgi:aspartyl-tRNA synthetase
MTDSIHRSHYANQVDDTLIGQEIRIGGWIEDIRDIGKLAFLIVRDITGVVQAIATGNNLQIVKEIPRQSVVIVSGFIKKSKAKDFSVELMIDKLILLAKAVHPLPIDPTGRVESATDKRLDSRALDLRNPKVSAIFIIRSTALQIIRDILLSKGFIEVHTPKIIGTASEGGANLFSLEYFKRKAYLAQSPQLYKEQLTMAMDKVFEIGPYFRAENSHTLRHLTEFISVDVEAAFLDYEDVMDLAEEVIRNVSTGLFKKCGKHLQLLRDSNSGEENTTSALSGRAIIPIPPPRMERLTYEQCLEDLKKEGQKLEFGDDLSDASLRILGEIHKSFYFIIDWPLKLKPFYIHEKEDNVRLSKSFDLQYRYLELVSGGRRQHDPRRLSARLKDQGLNTLNFIEHLKVFEWGMPPHSGWGMGFDRLMMIMTNAHNVRDVVLYPRDTERLIP